MAELPQHLLRPPEAYIEGHIKKVFEQTGFGGISLWTETGCTIFVNIDSNTIETFRVKAPAIELRFEEVDGVPLIWLDLLLAEPNGGEHNMFVFLNILDEQSVACLKALPYQSWIVIHWYDESRERVASSGVEWSPENRKKVPAIIEQARGVIERTGGGDFEEAKTRVTGGNLPS